MEAETLSTESCGGAGASPAARSEAAHPKPWPGDGILVLRAANDWDGPWFADQQMAVSLSRVVPVLYVDPARTCLGDAPRDSLVRPWIRSLGPNLTRLTPVASPGRHRRGISALTSFLVVRSVAKATRTLDVPIEALVDCAPLAPVLGRCGERRKIYWAQDDFTAMADLVGVSPASMHRGERHLAATADLIVAANPRVASDLSYSDKPTVLIPFGCDPAVFSRTIASKPASDIRLEGRIAGFMGHIGERIDVSLLDAVAASGVSVLLIGPRHPRYDVSALDALLSRPNVQWVGARQFEQLPEYLAAIDVGLVPYNHSPFNEASFPLKTLEYLAAGRPVVATDLPAIRWLDCPFIEVADTPTDFAAAVLRAVNAGRDPASRRPLQDFAAKHSWDERAAEFLRAVAAIRPD